MVTINKYLLLGHTFLLVWQTITSTDWTVKMDRNFEVRSFFVQYVGLFMRHSIIIQQINATTMSQNYLTLKYAMQNKN